jgi:Carboxypeptidase regulatory-like domain
MVRHRVRTLAVFAASLALALAHARFAQAAGTAGTIRGTIVGPDGKPMGGVPVQLRNDITGFKADVTTGADGTFQFFGVPFNPYELHVEVQGFKALHQQIDIRTAIPREVNISLELPAVAESVQVTGEPTAAQLETDTSMSHIDIDKSYIQRAPAAVASRAMEEIVTSTPGFAKDENGRYHFQGAHSQNEYVIDGQTISDQTGVTFSNSIDPGIAQSIEVIYGNVPAEFGEKVGSVINMVTKSALGTAGFKGDVYGGYSRFSTYEGGASAGSGTQNFGFFGSMNASGSDYFTDPVNFGNFNNHGTTQRAFLRFDAATPNLSNSFRLTALLGRTDRGVPNTFTQETNGQDKKVKTVDQNYNFGWQNVVTTNSVLDVTVYGRVAGFTLYPSAGDTPLVSHSDRTLDNYGITPSYTWTSGIHEVKAGAVVKRYPIHERFQFGITDPGFNDPASPDYNPDLAPFDLTRGGTLFDFDAKRTGNYDAAYLQDNIRLKNLTANIGLRWERNDLPVTDSQLEPRVGIAYYLPATGTVFRGTYNRVLYTPEYENILLSSSEQAAAIVPPVVKESRALGGGVLQVRSERQNAYTVGLQQAVGPKLRLDVDFWWRRGTFAGDQDQFENTGVVFPLAFARGRHNGWDVRLDLAKTWGFHGFLSLGHTHAIYVPPPAGGLFLDQGAVDAITGGPFLIDHDQKIQLQSGIFYDVGDTGVWLGSNIRYDSGLVTDTTPEELLADPDNAFAAPFVQVNSGTDLDPNRIKPRTIVDFSIGADLAKYHVPVDLQVVLLNAFDKKGVYNILSVFGGTHVIPPRRVAVRARVSF